MKGDQYERLGFKESLQVFGALTAALSSIVTMAAEHRLVITMEDGVRVGGSGRGCGRTSGRPGSTPA